MILRKACTMSFPPSTSYVIRAALLCAYGWLSVSNCFASDNEPAAATLVVYPARVVTTTDYPARFAVFHRYADGAMQLVGNDQIAASTVDAQVASVVEGSSVRYAADGHTQLAIDSAGQQKLLDIQAQADQPVTFGREVSAVLSKSGCNLGACHGNLHGKGGFRLSLRGDDPSFDFDRITSEYAGRRVDLFEPTQSLVLKKATGQIAHQGGLRFAIDSPEYDRVVRWLRDGAQDQPTSALKSISVFPRDIRIAYPNRLSQVIVLATFEDGSVRDVTRWSRIEPSSPMGVRISNDGRVEVDHPIDVSLNISYLNGRAAARVAFLGKSELADSTNITQANPIDQLVNRRLDELHLSPTPLADDATFIRRAYLVSVGRLPSSAQTRAYLADATPNKRERLIDQLLSDPGFDLLWSLRWGDLLRNEEKVMSPAGAAKFHDWLREQSAIDRPINEMVADLIGSIGSTYNNPPASYHRTHRDPLTAAESTAQVFLGVRIQCAKCHNHPFDVWRQDDYYGLSAYFTTIKREQIDNKPKDEFDKHIITGDEIISLEDRPAEIMHPGISKMISAHPLLTGFDQSSSVVTDEEKSPLKRLAHWLTSDNAMFDRNMANRVWSQYFGKGIVDPPDDFRDSNPPCNAELLNFISEELKTHHYSMRYLSRLILTSETFARSSASDILSDDELSPSVYFAGYPIHRMPAEILFDALSDATKSPAKLRGMVDEENGPAVITRAIAMPGVPRRAGFLTTFGKPNRLLACECERTNQVSLGQSLALLNGVEIREKLVAKNNSISKLCSVHKEDDAALIDEMYLNALTRFPTDEERSALEKYLRENSRGSISIKAVFRSALSGLTRIPMTAIWLRKPENAVANLDGRRRAAEDIMWSLVNSKEFIMVR
jgi:hypothetical protein